MNRAARLMALCAVATLGFQAELGTVARFAPTDLFVLLAVLFGGLAVTYRAGTVVLPALLFPPALVLMLAPVVARGHLPSIHSLVVKIGGAFILAVSYLIWQHHFRSSEARRQAVALFMVGGMLISLAGLATWFGASYPFSDVLFFQRARYVGGLVDPNNFGAFMACALIFSILCFPYPFRARWVASVNVVAAAIFLAMSTSRGAWVAAVVVLGAAMFAFGRVRVRHFVVTGVVGVLAVAFGLVEMANSEFSGRPDNVGDRLNQVDIGLDLAMGSPFTGIGLGEFQLYHDGIIHNSLMWLWVEGGAVGVILFLSFAISPMLHMLGATPAALPHERRLLEGLLGAHLCMLVVSIGIEATYQRYWWFYLAMSTSVVREIHARSAATADSSRVARDLESGPVIS